MDTTKLQEEISGPVTRPGDDGWDRARASWNLTVDQRPALVVEAETAQDVQAAVRMAASAGLRVAPQSTGHGSEPLGSLEGSMLLKTSRLRDLKLDPDTGIARAGAGVQAGQLADATEDRGAPLGFSGVVGVTGLCLSGGVGWLSRTHGLACNSVVGFDVVLADGQVARVDRDTNPDLFWALRGGGSRCAVVTSIEVQTHPLPQISGGVLMWPATRIDWVLERFLELTRNAPESLSVAFRYLSVPDVEGPPPPLRGKQFACILAVDIGGASGVAESLRGNGEVMDSFGPIQAPQLVRLAGDPEAPTPGLGAGFMVEDLDAEALGTLSASAIGSPLTVIEIRHLDGALSRSPQDPGALSRLTGRYSLFATGAVLNPESGAAVQTALTDLQQQLARWASPTALLGSAPVGTPPADCFDPQTWERLRAIDEAHDPEGLIQSNREAV